MDNKKEVQEFERFVAACEVERLRQLDVEFEESGEAAECEKRKDQLYKKLKNALPQDMVLDLSRYADACLWKRTLTRVFFYGNGLKDGMALTKMLAPGSENIRLDINIT